MFALHLGCGFFLSLSPSLPPLARSLWSDIQTADPGLFGAEKGKGNRKVKAHLKVIKHNSSAHGRQSRSRFRLATTVQNQTINLFSPFQLLKAMLCLLMNCELFLHWIQSWKLFFFLILPPCKKQNKNTAHMTDLFLLSFLCALWKHDCAPFFATCNSLLLNKHLPGDNLLERAISLQCWRGWCLDFWRCIGATGLMACLQFICAWVWGGRLFLILGWIPAMP